jgi:ketosteroid isomerase-like protein
MGTWTKTLTVLAVVVGIGGLVYVQAQRKTASNALTTQDYIELQQLVARYAYAVDGGLDHGKGVADLYTDDGALFGRDGQRWVGRKELLALFDKEEETPNNVVHFYMNHLIEPTATGAVGKEYVIIIRPSSDDKDGGRSFRVTPLHYDDVYVKTPDGWRFKSRTVIEHQPAGRQGAATVAR